MPALTKQQFLQAIEPKREKVPLPEVGPDAYAHLQALDGPGLVELQNRFGGEGKSSNLQFAVHLLRLCLIDDDGNRLFPAVDPESNGQGAAAIEADVKALFGGKGFLLIQLSDAAIRLSGLPAREEGAEKN